MTLLETIGRTPLVRLSNLTLNADVSIWAKCEFLNPTGSIKDRIVAYIVEQAEANGLLKPGATLIESTSGNTGAAVAMIAAIKGYRAMLVIPDRVSQEKQSVLKALGAEVRVLPSEAPIDSPQHYVNVAKQLHADIPNSYYINQYHNLQNPQAHYQTTGPEIWEQMQGQIDVFVTVAGSGGTVSGIGRYLKEKNPAIQIIAVDPIGSVYHSYFKKGVLPSSEEMPPCLVEGAGEDHLTRSMDFSVIDDIIQFQDQDAFKMAHRLAKAEGMLAGGTSGANVWAAVQIAKQATKPLRIVTILPDNGIKYLSKFYNDAWIKEKGL